MNDNYQEAFIDQATGVAIVSDIDPGEMEVALSNGAFSAVGAQIHRALASWAEGSSPSDRSGRGVFHRDRFVTPSETFQQMAMAYDAADDDIVGNVLDTSESLAFQKVHFDCEDADQEDIWNQIGRDLDLDGFLRSCFRELSLVSQVYGVRLWGNKTYQVRGKGPGKRQRRKQYDLRVPVGLGLLDPLRIVPVQADILGHQGLAWIGTDNDVALLESVASGRQVDDVVQEVFLRKYEPPDYEKKLLSEVGVPTETLILLNPDNVWSHALTKSPYERWARVRMKSIFPLLDLKHQLREMDRAWLLGGINFVVLVTRGSDARPTSLPEIEETATQVRTASKSPIIVSDHRITMEIITPDVEHVLSESKWSVVDERIMMRLWGTFSLPSRASGRETSLTLGKVIAAGLNTRRHMLKRMVEKEIVRPVQDRNLDQDFDSRTKLEYSPRRVELAFDSDLVTLIQELRDRGDLSRQTVLEEFMFDQEMEAQRREREDEEFGDTFKPVNVPFDSPNKTTPGGSGRKTPKPATPPNPEGNNGK